MRTHVLVVEDDHDAGTIYAASLEHAGHEVTLARTAREALDAVRVRRPDAVVLDRRLPDRDGLELARKWRASPAMAKTPIVILTAHAARADVEAALAAGCDAFLAKPCTGDVLSAHVGRLLAAVALVHRKRHERP